MEIPPLFIYLFAALLYPARCLYFKVDYGSERCFYETVPARAMLSINYELRNQEARECVIQISGPNEETLATHNLHDLPEQGRVTYVAKETANYNVCIQCNSHYWYLSQECKMSLSLEIADGSDDIGRATQYDIDETATAKKDEIRELSTEINRFAASVLAIRNHQQMESKTANRLYQTYKTTNRYILYFYLAEIFIICITGCVSVYHVTRFFKNQRVI